MALDKEQAKILADQIIKQAEEKGIAERNAAAVHARIPLMCRTKRLMAQEPYHRIQILRQARDQAYQHSIYRYVLYVYILVGFIFFWHVLKTSQTISPIDTYFIMALSLVAAAFALYREYLVRYYIFKILKQSA